MVLDRLRTLVGRRSQLFRECRNCGTTLDDGAAAECPTCGSAEVATYEL